MLRHHHISEQSEAIPATHPIQNPHELIPRTRCSQKRPASVTTEGQEVQVSASVVAPQRSTHKSQNPHPWTPKGAAPDPSLLSLCGHFQQWYSHPYHGASNDLKVPRVRHPPKPKKPHEKRRVGSERQGSGEGLLWMHWRSRETQEQTRALCERRKECGTQNRLDARPVDHPAQENARTDTQKRRVGHLASHVLRQGAEIKEGFIAQKACDGEEVLASQTTPACRRQARNDGLVSLAA